MPFKCVSILIPSSKESNGGFSSRSAWLNRLAKIIVIFLCLVVLFLDDVFGASQTLLLTPSKERWELGPFLEILEDKEKKWDIEDVSSPTLTGNFKQIKSQTINQAAPTSSAEVQGQEWILDLGRSKMLRRCSLYIPEPSKSGEITTGQWTVEERSLKQTVDSGISHYNQLFFYLPKELEIPRTFYLRVEHHSALVLALSIYSSDAFMKESRGKMIWLGVYYGIIFAMFFFNLFVFIFLRDRIFLYYLLYLSSVALYFIFLNGLAFEYLPAGPVKLHHALSMIILGFTIFWGVCFAKTFLLTDKYSRTIDKSLVTIMVLALALMVMAPFVEIKYLNHYSSVLGMISPLTVLFAAFVCWRRGFRPVLFFIIAWSILCIGGLTYASTYRGIIPYSLLTFHSFQIGSGIEVVVLSLALVDRVRILKGELQKSEEKYETILHSIQEGYYETDIAGNLTFFNDSWCKIIGYSRDELMGMNYRRYMSEETAKEVYQTFNEVYRTGKSAKAFDWETIRKNGTTRYLEISVSLMVDSKGHPTGFRGIVRDITERKQAEEQAELHQQQLMQASKMVAVGTLVSGVAHEINNPNNFIMLNSPLLLEAWESAMPILDEYYRENGDFILGGIKYSQARENLPKLFSGILGGAKRINQIVEELRSFVREESPDLNQSVDINAVIKSAISLVSSMIKKSTGRFLIEYGDSLPEIKGNFQRLEQVMINLIQNACQSLMDNQSGIFVSTSYDREMDNIVAEIRDEGGGILPENLSHITDPFFTTKRDSGGLGLGLSISSRIVKEHGGNISFNSQSGKGTTVQILLPVKKGNNALTGGA
jgi:PAS domain S-box-containing protein